VTFTLAGRSIDALSDTGGGPPSDGGPVLQFDTITVSDDAVAVAGRVRDGVALVSSLSINGQRVPIDAHGRFFAVVPLEGYEGLSFWLDAGIHGEVMLDLPLRAS
jgi:hypothetical protein